MMIMMTHLDRAGDVEADQGEQQGVTEWRLVARLN